MYELPFKLTIYGFTHCLGLLQARYTILLQDDYDRSSACSHITLYMAELPLLCTIHYLGHECPGIAN